MFEDSTCNKCNGSGYSKRKSERCLCKNICAKCEHNEGYIIHPYEMCDYCCGTGNLKYADMVLCRNKIQ